MYFFARSWGDGNWIAPDRAAVSLGLFAGHAADQCRIASDFFAELPAPRAPARKGWRVSRSPAGTAVLLLGVIDNLAELRAELGLGNATAEATYAAALERWDDRADSHVIGEYASLAVLPDGRVRMARSPWCGWPLFYHRSDHGLMAASIPRPLFAAGLPKRLRPGVIERMLSFEQFQGEQCHFEGLEQVSGGTVVTFDRDRRTVQHFYDPATIRPVRFRRSEDYVEAARETLAEAVGKCLVLAKRPAVTLSGGLDSALIADEMLRQLPAGQRLKSFTFVPLPEWDGSTAPQLFGNDRPYVEQFLQGRDGIDATFLDNADLAPDSFANERMLAADIEFPSVGLGFVHLGLGRAARDAGCDWLFWGSLGNMTVSGEAPWAPAALFRRMRWGQVWQLARTRLGDPRPMWRRFLATGLMPNLPPGLRDAIRSLKPADQGIEQLANPYLSSNGPLAAKREDRNLSGSSADIEYFHSRERFIPGLYDSMAIGGEMALGIQQLFGVRGRDIYGYRPLIELCLGMPDDQFVGHGERRLLARRMAEGRLPEAQRTEQRHGDHVPDWHARMQRQLPQLRAEVQRIADHPELGSLIDTQRMLHDLDTLPEVAPTDMPTIGRLRFALHAAMATRRYVDFVSGRNAP